MKQNLRSFLKAILPFVKKPLTQFLSLCNPHFFQEKLSVVVYHDVSDTPSEFSKKYSLNVEPDIFDKQIAFFKKQFNIISPEDLLNGNELPQKPMLITFDDGFLNVFKNALPILSYHNVPVLLFLNYGPVKGEMFWAGLITFLCDNDKDFCVYLEQNNQKMKENVPDLLKCSQKIVFNYLKSKNLEMDSIIEQYVGSFVTETILREQEKNQLVYLGNHLYNHYVSALMSDDEFITEYLHNEQELEKYCNHINMFSFPFGQPGSCFSEHQIELLKLQGVRKIFTSSGALNIDSKENVLDRIGLINEDSSPNKILFRLYERKIRELPIVRYFAMG